MTKFSLHNQPLARQINRPDSLVAVHIVDVVVSSPIGSLDIWPHGPPSQLAFSIVDLVWGFIQQIRLVLDT